MIDIPFASPEAREEYRWQQHLAHIGRPNRNGDIFRQLADPSGAREAIAAINGFTRIRLREDGFMRRILPPTFISNDELDRSVDTDRPVRVDSEMRQALADEMARELVAETDRATIAAYRSHLEDQQTREDLGRYLDLEDDLPEF